VCRRPRHDAARAKSSRRASPMTDHQTWARRLSNDFFSDAAHQHMCHAASSVRAYDDQIDIPTLVMRDICDAS